MRRCVIDHFKVVANTITRRLGINRAGVALTDRVGGSTQTLDVWHAVHLRVCSKPCVQLADCSPLSSAADCTPLGKRVAQGRCDGTQIGAMCDAVCLTDYDYSALDCREPGPGSPAHSPNGEHRSSI